MTCFAPRTGKDELLRLADLLEDMEIPDRCDACLGLLALVAVQMIGSSPQDAAASMFQLARMMEGFDA